MRVLMVNTFHHRRGGDATYALSLTRLLERDGHEVIPLAMRHPDNEPSTWERWFVPWVDYRDLHGPRAIVGALRRYASNPDAREAAAALIDRFRPDVVHLQHVHHHLTPSVVGAARRRGIPVVWTVHDYELICPAGTLFTHGRPCEECRGHRYHRAVVNRCKRDAVAYSALAAAEKAAHALSGLWTHVDRFLCPSAFLADMLVKFGIPRDRVFHQPNFVDLPGDPAPLGSGWMYAGRLTEEKGVDVLAAAARLLGDAPLAICGTGPREEALRTALAGLPNAHLHGHLAAGALASRLRDAAVVAVPSLWWENLPYAVIEAQAAGRAVVASRIGGIPELVDDGVDGILVPPGDAGALADAVRGLLADRGRARKLGAAGVERVRARLGPGPHLVAMLAHYRAVT
jgi:glycosyltransferase involved in cell wall biosynthesis